MSSKPSVDVIIAAFNAEKFIAEALNSLATQTLQPDCITVTDDGSTDATAEVVRRWANQQRIPVRLIRQRNAGPSAARNAAIRSSTADLIALLDADDISLPGTLASLVNAFLRIDNLAMCFGDASQFNIHGTITSSFLSGKSVDQEPLERHPCGARIFSRQIFTSLVTGNYIPPSTAMFPRNLALEIGLFDTALKRAEDLDFFMRLSRKGAVAYYPRVLARRRCHDDNLTNPRHAILLADYRVQVLTKMLRSADALELTKSEIDAARRSRNRSAGSLLYHASCAGWTIYIRYVHALLQQGVLRAVVDGRDPVRALMPAGGMLLINRMQMDRKSARRASLRRRPEGSVP